MLFLQMIEQIHCVPVLATYFGQTCVALWSSVVYRKPIFVCIKAEVRPCGTLLICLLFTFKCKRASKVIDLGVNGKLIYI